MKTIHEILPVGKERPQLQERLGCCAGHTAETGGNAKCQKRLTASRQLLGLGV